MSNFFLGNVQLFKDDFQLFFGKCPTFFYVHYIYEMKRDIDPYPNFDQRRDEIIIKQEVQDRFISNPKTPTNLERIIQPEIKQEAVKIEEPDKGETVVIMQKNLLHLFNYICQFNGEIMWFICEKLIEHDQIKVFCVECSESEWIRMNATQDNDKFNRKINQDLPVYSPESENYLNSVKFKYSNDENKPIKRYKSSKKEKPTPYIYWFKCFHTGKEGWGHRK